MAVSVEMMMGEVMEKSESCAEKCTQIIKPYAKSLAKFGTLFFHIMICFLIVFKFKQFSLFIGYSLGLQGEKLPCTRENYELPGEDLLVMTTRSLDACLDKCRIYNSDQAEEAMDGVDVPSCRAVSWTGDREFKANCWLKEMHFKESTLVKRQGFFTRNLNCKDDDPLYSKTRFPKQTSNLMVILTVLVLLTRVVSLILIVLNKHIFIACFLLAIPFVVSIGIHLKLMVDMNFHPSSIPYLLTILSLLGCLLMILADSMEEKDLHYIVGLPSWGINKKMSYITLICRINIVLIFFGSQMNRTFDYIFQKNGIGIFTVIQLLVLIPVVISVVVGYKTKVMSVILASWLTLASLFLHPFFLHLAQGMTFRFWMDVVQFGVNFSGVGSLVYISVLGAGAYSVDHVKRQ